MKIYFGVMPKGNFHVVYLYNIDTDIAKWLQTNKVEDIQNKIKEYRIDDPNKPIHTFNPLILNWLSDEFGQDNIYWFDKLGKERKFSENDNFMNKLKYLGIGEVCCDSDEFYQEYY